MLVIVAYDVSTETSAGRRRLRRVAKVCERVGQRVQESLFECRVDEVMFESLEKQLLSEIDPSEDNLRFYRIIEPINVHVREYGCFRATDFDGPLLI